MMISMFAVKLLWDDAIGRLSLCRWKLQKHRQPDECRSLMFLVVSWYVQLYIIIIIIIITRRARSPPTSNKPYIDLHMLPQWTMPVVVWNESECS